MAVFIVFTIVYQFFPYTSYLSGAILAVCITPVVAFPLGYIITYYSKTLESKHVELQKNNELKNRLIYVLSHDIKSPLINIQEILRLINNEHLDPKEFKNISENLYKDVDRTLTLTNNLISWINLQHDEFQPKVMTFDVAEVLKESVELYEPMAEKKGIDLKMTTQEVITVDSDPEMWKIVFRNLISNAVKFTKPKGYVHVGVRQDEDEVVGWVADNGLGIPEDKVPNVLHQNFNDSQLGTSNEKGTGLGLHLVKNIIDRLNGDISIESEVGKGTSFYLSIPVN